MPENQILNLNHAIEFSVTDSAINILAEKYLPLKINGITDIEGYKNVRAARLVVKSHRVDIDKRRKELTADALEYQRRINAEAKRVTSLLEPIEQHLSKQENDYEAEKERIKREKYEAEQLRIKTRTNALLKMDFVFDGINYGADYTSSKFQIEQLKSLDDAVFDELINKVEGQYIDYKDALAEIARKEQEEKEAEAAKVRAENERIAKEKAAIEEEKKKLAEIAQAQAEKEAELKKLQEEHEQSIAAKLADALPVDHTCAVVTSEIDHHEIIMPIHSDAKSQPTTLSDYEILFNFVKELSQPDETFDNLNQFINKMLLMDNHSTVKPQDAYKLATIEIALRAREILVNIEKNI